VAQELLGPRRWKKVSKGLSCPPSSFTTSLDTLIKEEENILNENQEVQPQPHDALLAQLQLLQQAMTASSTKTEASSSDHQDEPLDLTVKKSSSKNNSSLTPTSTFIPYTPQLPLSLSSQHVFTSLKETSKSEIKTCSSASSSPLMVVNPSTTSTATTSSSPSASSPASSCLR